MCGEWAGQSCDLRQVLQLKWVIVSGMRDVIITEACLFVVLGDPTFGTSQVFVVYVSRKVSLIEGLQCGCLSHHATIAESLGPSLWVVSVNVCLERRGEGRFGGGGSWCWVSPWKQQGKSVGRGELVFVGGLLCLSGDC